MASAATSRPDGPRGPATSNRETSHRPSPLHLPRGDWAQGKIAAVLAHTGIALNGNLPWDIRVLAPRFYQRVLLEGSLGAGESWDFTPRLL